MPDRGLGAGTDHGSEAPGCLGVGSGPGLEVPVPGVGRRQDGPPQGTEAITRCLGPVRDRVHTGTADHGQEFARHRAIAQKLNAGFSFATPYPSWERGRNEHPNGRVRPYFPKRTDFRQVTPAQVRAVADRLHRRPRKVLGVRTPAEVFARGLAPPGRGPRSSIEPGTPGPLVIHRSGFARPPGPERALALADGFGQDRRQSRWLPSVAEKKRSQREFLGRRRDPSLRATPPGYRSALHCTCVSTDAGPGNSRRDQGKHRGLRLQSQDQVRIGTQG